MNLTTKWLFKLAPLYVGVIVIAGMLIVFNVNRAPIYHELVMLDLIPQPERLTELYFKDNTNLPNSATRNQAISFAFVVHNLETTDCQYVYNVVIDINGTRHIIDNGHILVKNDQYFIKNERFNLIDAPGSQNVIVELTNKRQSIDFWTGK